MRLAHCTAAAAVGVLLAVSACSPDISPDKYATAATQKANKVDQGVIVGVRQVTVTVDGNTGAVAGAAAGGILGAQSPGSQTASALGAVGGGVLGGLLGSSVEKATGDTTAFEYIVRKSNGDLVSVTQADTTPLAIGQTVLVINGNQARIVPDYTVQLPSTGKKDQDKKKDVASDKPKTDQPAKGDDHAGDQGSDQGGDKSADKADDAGKPDAKADAPATAPLVLPPLTLEPSSRTKLPQDEFPPKVSDTLMTAKPAGADN